LTAAVDTVALVRGFEGAEKIDEVGEAERKVLEDHRVRGFPEQR
jgi:hypothetical protein